MQPNSLHDLYLYELKDLYNAEQQIVKALPKMAGAAKSPELQRAFEDHLDKIRHNGWNKSFRNLVRLPKVKKINAKASKVSSMRART